MRDDRIFIVADCRMTERNDHEVQFAFGSGFGVSYAYSKESLIDL